MRPADEVPARGVPIAEVARSLGASEVTPHRWRAEDRAIDPDAVRHPSVLGTLGFLRTCVAR